MKIAIYIRQYSTENEAILRELFSHLLPEDEVFIECEILKELNIRSHQFLRAKPFKSFADLNNSYEVMLTIGGDGTLLKGITYLRDLQIPILGINLGHFILGMACGAKIKSLKTGIHGGTPVLNLTNQKVILTSQNQNFSLEQESLKNTDLEETYITLNNKLNQGIRHKKHACLSVQFNPEANPGSEDSRYIFDEFIDMIEKFKK